MVIFLLLALFTVTFAVTGVVTYRICRKKAVYTEKADKDGDSESSGR